MKTARLYGVRDIRIEQEPAPDVQPGELLLDVTAVSICGSDLHSYLYGEIGGVRAQSPLILGHEAAGIVRGIGDGVTGYRIGQRVAIEPAIPCFHCERCLKGQQHLCKNLQFIGLWPRQGALREQMAHPAHCCVPVPDGISDIDTALLEPLGVALHAIRLAKIEVGDSVLVVGCGTIGLLLVALAKLAGAGRIYAADSLRARLELAQHYGADVSIKVDTTNVVEFIEADTKKRGVDVAIEAAWADSTLQECADAARNGGRVIVVGIPIDESVSFPAASTRRKGLTIKFSRRMNHTYTAAIDLVANGKLDLRPLASHLFPLDEAKQAFEIAANYQDNVIRAVVQPNIVSIP